jgi:anti-sigma regulatory factor (Ser/Thr protein kinase)
VGEPAWPGRREVEFAEAELHETLLNLAFEDSQEFRLLCPYDYSALPPDVLEEALLSHPVVHDGQGGRIAFAGHGQAHVAFDISLPPAPSTACRFTFAVDDLAIVRGIVRRFVQVSSLPGDAVDDLVLAAHEVATNSVMHAGGHGTMLLWDAPDSLVIEIRDDGLIDDPLVGRGYPDFLPENGRGIWMANRLCDLVQVRSGPDGTQVRLHAWL